MRSPSFLLAFPALLLGSLVLTLVTRESALSPESAAEVSVVRAHPWHVGALTREEAGSEIELPFELDGIRHARVISRAQLPDGRQTASLRLAGGSDLFLVARGDRWEARALPRGNGNGWRLEGDSTGSSLTRLPKSALICHSDFEVAGLPPMLGYEDENPAPRTKAAAAAAAPLFHSLEGATAVIYLDFDGETVSGTQWNSSFTGGAPIVAGGAPFSSSQIEELWLGVAEDFSPFDINVTTDRAAYDAAPLNRRVMVIFTPDNEWYGSAGGVAYVDVFGSSLMDPPAWVFTDQLSNSVSFAAEAASHEAGHTLGLRHDGDAASDYHLGSSQWAPIMGAAYSAAVSQWSKGEYAGATNTEDDLAIISSSRNGFGYYPDDHSETSAGATALELVGLDTLEGWGYIERDSDTDVFMFQTTGGPVEISADNAERDPNLDIRLALLDQAGNEIAVSDPSSSLDATLATSLASGSYFLAVTGVGNNTSGYTGYGSLGEYELRVTAPQSTNLAAEIVSPAAAEISLPYGTGLRLKGLASGGSASWLVVQTPSGATVTLSDPNASATDATFSHAGLYQVRFSSTLDSQQESDLITIAVDDGAPTYTTRAPAVVLGADRDVYGNRIQLDPLVTDDSPSGALTFSWTVLSGPAQLTSPNAPTSELLFNAAYSEVRLRLEVSDGSQIGFAEVSLTAHFKNATFAVDGAYARVLVPSSAPPAGWDTPLFNDSAWAAGNLGAGYDTTPGGNPKNPSRRILLPEINLDLASAMDGSRTTCYVRIPFHLVVAPEDVLSLQLRMKYDDGFVASINGIEVARDNAGSGTPAWNATAPADRPDEEALSSRTFTLDLPPGTLSAGSNVLAIHALNSSTGSADRRFLVSAEMDGVIADPDPGLPPLTPFVDLVSGIADPELRGIDDDPDGDGLTNLYEHATGTSPTSADPGGQVMRASGQTASVVLPEPPPDDVLYFLEYSATLGGTWDVLAGKSGTGAWTGITPITSVPDEEGHARHSFPTGSGTAGFYRLRMELAP